MSVRSGSRHLVIVARRPAIGVGKRRLAADVGDVEAWRFQRTCLDLLLASLGGRGPWRTWAAVTPDRQTAWLAGRATPLPQGGGDLGQRLERLAARFAAGAVVIIGSDTPTVRPADIAAAFRVLRSHDAVVGPAVDGGYWLIGLRRRAMVRGPFRGVRWSSPETLADTLARLGGLRVASLRTLEDVDDLASLRRVTRCRTPSV
ncbi:MAG: TIGR04282 family arsenosugar biosynthesis glycosyltransferase [Caulobacter sp.]|nr:TIGR04282 family arsenosugar biosynthesis glycosyltransferase [Caulobacter sp.]